MFIVVVRTSFDIFNVWRRGTHFSGTIEFYPHSSDQKRIEKKIVFFVILNRNSYSTISLQKLFISGSSYLNVAISIEKQAVDFITINTFVI